MAWTGSLADLCPKNGDARHFPRDNCTSWHSGHREQASRAEAEPGVVNVKLACG